MFAGVERGGIADHTEHPGSFVMHAPAAPARDPAGASVPLRHGRVSKFLVPEVVFGVGTLAEVGGAVRRVGGQRALLVSDPGVLEVGWADHAREYLDEAGVEHRL